jgi:Ca2+-binding RTX toxin-like protein
MSTNTDTIPEDEVNTPNDLVIGDVQPEPIVQDEITMIDAPVIEEPPHLIDDSGIYYMVDPAPPYIIDDNLITVIDPIDPALIPTPLTSVDETNVIDVPEPPQVIDDSSMVVINPDPIYLFPPPITLIEGTENEDTLTGTEMGDWIQGYAGDDNLSGDAGNDSLEGGDGNDTLDGGAGSDRLTGGQGDDTYLFAVGSGYDTLFDDDKSGINGNDLVILENLAQADVGFEKINDIDLRITINATGESLYIYSAFNTNEDSSDSGSTIETFQFSDGTLDLAQVSALSTVIYYGYATTTGTDADDVLTGTGRNDWMDGGLGNDTIIGNAGYDQLIGGDGNDSLEGGDSSDTLQGGAGDDSLDGGAGDDWLNGGDGDDTYIFAAGYGNDYIYEYDWNSQSSAGNDRIIFKNLAQADVSFEKIDNLDLRVTINETGETLYISSAYGTDTQSNVETLQFSDGSLDLAQVSALSTEILHFISGTEGDDVLKGGKDYNTLQGLAGNDTLDGGAGYDWMTGGLGDDTYIFSKGYDSDSISESDISGAGGNDLVILKDLALADVSFEKITNFGPFYARPLFVVNDGIRAPDDIGTPDTESTNTFDLRITINETGESLYISGVNGNVSADNNTTIENFQFTDATLSLDDVFALSTEVSYPIYYAYDKVLSVAPEFISSPAAPEVISSPDTPNTPPVDISTFNTVGNDFKGTERDDALEGTVDNDTIKGGGGNDALNGHEGNDDIRGGQGDDSLNGGNGDDTLQGRIGNDHLVGELGNDDLRGGEGDDDLKGGVGDDYLTGGKNRDVLTGGDGNDVLTGGRGADIFHFDTLVGVDTITDFKIGKDLIQLDSSVFSALTAGNLATDSFVTGANALAADSNDFVLYDTTTGSLSYDADGNGSGAAVQIALIGIAIHPDLTAADFIVI